MLFSTRFHDFSAPLRLCERLLVLSLVLAVSPAASANQNATNEPLRKACEYLWSQQVDDSGWHSEQYAVLRSGQALTPFVLHALLQVPESICPRPEGGVRRALDFIHQHVDEHGAIGKSDPDIVEYPVYSTAYSVLCLRGAGTNREDQFLIRRMLRFLRNAQFNERHGFSRDHLAFGGWGFDAPKSPGDPGHMDLAHTRRVLQAIAFDSPIRTRGGDSLIVIRSLSFLHLVQKHPDAVARQPLGNRIDSTAPATRYDGGFYFSPVVLAANKGREEIEDGSSCFRSYATATCDGVLALLAAGVPRSDARVVRAVHWLEAHDVLNYPQGVPMDYAEPWGDAVRFYHYAVRAEAYAALDLPGDWRSQLAAAVAKTQAADGSFRNGVSPLMKEDDPLLCTALAVVALGHCAE